MRRSFRVPALTIAALALVATVIGGLPLAGFASQDTGDGDRADHPIVGTWLWLNNPDEDATIAGPSYAIFHADGSYVEFYPLIGVGIGTWDVTGPDTATLTIVFQDINEDANVFEPGTSTYRIAIEVDSTGDTLTGTGDLVIRDTAGTEVLSEPFTGTATRMMLEAPGTPAATPAT